jgi:hypothetical protein
MGFVRELSLPCSQCRTGAMCGCLHSVEGGWSGCDRPVCVLARDRLSAVPGAIMSRALQTGVLLATVMACVGQSPPPVRSQCDPGKYQCSASSCCFCPAGKYGRSIGLTSCLTCSAGRYSYATGATTCNICPAAQYSAAGATSCSLCPSGRTSPGDSCCCTDCAAGRWGVGCAACPAGTTSLAGATGCTDCAAGRFSTIGAGTSR